MVVTLKIRKGSNIKFWKNKQIERVLNCLSRIKFSSISRLKESQKHFQVDLRFLSKEEFENFFEFMNFSSLDFYPTNVI